MPARVSILRTNNTIFPQHALVVSDTFELSQRLVLAIPLNVKHELTRQRRWDKQETQEYM